jgi:hypothetical protein
VDWQLIIPGVFRLAEISYLEYVGWQLIIPGMLGSKQVHTWMARGGQIFRSGENVVAADLYLEKMWWPHIYIWRKCGGHRFISGENVVAKKM